MSILLSLKFNCMFLHITHYTFFFAYIDCPNSFECAFIFWHFSCSGAYRDTIEILYFLKIWHLKDIYQTEFVDINNSKWWIALESGLKSEGVVRFVTKSSLITVIFHGMFSFFNSKLKINVQQTMGFSNCWQRSPILFFFFTSS